MKGNTSRIIWSRVTELLLRSSIFKIRSTLLIFFLLIFIHAPSAKAAQFKSVQFDDLTIVVSSCDKYRELWHPFFTFLFKNWPSLNNTSNNISIILITNHKKYEDPRVTVMQMGEEESWSSNMLRALANVKTKYILYLQEDFIIHLPIREQLLYDLLQIMKREKAAYFELTYDSFFANAPRHPKFKNIAIKNASSKYRAALQACIWEKKIFEMLLDSKEGPWQFENFGSIRSQKFRKSFWIIQENHPIIYFNACDRGYWASSVLEYIKAQNIDIPIRRLPVDKDHILLHWVKHYYPKFYKLISELDTAYLGGVLCRHEQSQI